MRIQHNISAMNSYRQMGGNNNALSKNLEKLSSGYRINRAGDDAAGLAISEKMRAQIKGLETAQKNANDGISLVQTAEGALTEVHSMLNRMTELATQSANGTYDDKVDRANLQKEVSALLDEIDRISESTNFNGINLLDGSLGGTDATGSGLVGGKIAKFKAAEWSIGTGGDATADNVDFSAKDIFVIDGTKVEVDWSKLTSEEQTALKVGWDTNNDEATTKKAAAILEKTINAAIDETNAKASTSVNHITVQSNGATGFKVKSGLNDSNASKIEIIGKTETNKSVAGIIFKAGDANSATEVVEKAKATEQLMIDATKLKGKFDMLIDGEKIEVDMAVPTASGSDIATKLKAAIDTALTNYDKAKGTTDTGDALKDKITVKFNDKGSLEFTNTTDKKISFEDKNGNDLAEMMGISASGKAVMSGGLTLQIGDTADDFNKLTVQVDDMSANSLGIANVDISKQGTASAAIDKIKAAINKVSSTRGDLGAAQNRLEHTINNLGVTTENITAAESRIRDTDMASEMMKYTKNNILIQASQAMLAQANQVPQGVLQLLQ